MYLYIQSAAAAAAALCVAIPLLLLQQLLLFVVVCRMAKNVGGSLNLIPPSVFFLFKYDLFSMYAPLGSAVALSASICLYYLLGNYGHARSQGGRQPAAVKPRLYLTNTITLLTGLPRSRVAYVGQWVALYNQHIEWLSACAKLIPRNAYIKARCNFPQVVRHLRGGAHEADRANSRQPEQA